MRIEKALKKAIKVSGECLSDEDKASYEEFQSERLLSFEEVVRLANKYYSFEEYMKEDILWGTKLNKMEYDIFSAHKMQDRIVSYKAKMALKNNKNGIIKNDPRKKAFIDISDGLTRYQKKNKCGFKIACCGFESGKEGFKIKIAFKGKICIPFNSCFIYTHLPNMFANVVEIKDNEDGTYSGTFWTMTTRERIIQMSFEIKREEFDWVITLHMPSLQKPLGQCTTNISTLINLVAGAEKDNTFICVDDETREEKLKYFKDYIGYYFADFAFNIAPIISYLSSYRSKVVYKLTKENNIYVYSDNAGEDVEEYIKENYPDYTYEQLTGWLVGGYWNFLKPNEFGVNSKGKKIKGMTWITPYDDKKDTIESNEQVTRYVPNHALERVKQRYNLDLTSQDLQEIAKACLKGKNITKLSIRDKLGRLYTPNGIKGCYRVPYKNNIFDVVLSRGIDSRSYRIATFLPKPKELNCAIIDSKDYNEVMKGIE